MTQHKKSTTWIFLLITIWQVGYSQKKDIISFGLNVAHFIDWQHKPLNFFNPEIRYTKALDHNNAIDMGINAFYAQADAQDFKNPGDVFQRLIFSADAGFKKYFNHFSANIGPTVRYRNEKIMAPCNSCPSWEKRIEPQKGFVDFGGLVGANYELLVNAKSSFEIRMAYRFYTKGVNPFTLGLFYNRRL